MLLNLRPYGIDWEIDTNQELHIPDDIETKIAEFVFHVNPKDQPSTGNYLKVGGEVGVKYSITFGRKRGEGSYGTAYDVTHEYKSEDVPLGVVKILNKNYSPLKQVILEFLIQIIIYEDTKDITGKPPRGPFVPAPIYIGLDKEFIYILTESMDYTLEKYLEDKAPKARSIINIIKQLSTILLYLQQKDHFSHRDLKANNIMMKGGHVRLIDFGLSCLEHDHIKINVTNGRFVNPLCDKQDRDMSSFFYDLLLFNYKDPRYPLGQVIRRLLGATPKKWKDQYTFYNTSKPNIFMRPEVVYAIFSDMVPKEPENPFSEINPSYMAAINKVVYEEGNTILHKAAETNDLYVVKQLLQIPELKVKTLNTAGLTAYHVAALSASKWWASEKDNEFFDLLITVNPTLASKKTPDGKTADELTTIPELRTFLLSKKVLMPAFVRNTDKKWWGGRSKKDLKRRRGSTRRR